MFPIDALLLDWMQPGESDREIALFQSGARGAAGGIAWVDANVDVSVTVLLPGSAWMLSERAARITKNDATFWSLTNRWLYDRFNVTARRLVCSAEHNLDRRLARMLLWVVDETGHLEVALTHREIAMLTAIRRPSVSLTLASFQKYGLVRLGHGLVHVVDREGLEKQCCSCYRVIRSLVGDPPDRHHGVLRSLVGAGVEDEFHDQTVEGGAGRRAAVVDI
jgi:CRP-like cAMP-binding protein